MALLGAERTTMGCKHGSNSQFCGWCEDQAELSVAHEQVKSLRAALAKVLDTRDKEAKAHLSYQNAIDNFSGGAQREGRQHLAAMTAASNAEKEARLLLATLRAPNPSISG